MASVGDSARPATQMRSRSFQAPSSKENNEACLEWLKSSGLRRDQIVSITNHESDIEEGDQVLIVFYRESSIHKNPVPCDAVQYAMFDNGLGWDDLLEEANGVLAESAGADVLGLSRSAKNVGEANNQVVWFSKETAGVQGMQDPVSIREFIRQDGDFFTLLEEVKTWMNEHLPPHLLVSVTAHEDSHPNETQVVRVLVAHKAGYNPKPLSESAAAKTLPAYGLYTLQTQVGGADEEWDAVAARSLEQINNLGGQEGFAITSANTSGNEGKLIAVFAWTGLFEAQIQEDLRPAGCCTIF